MATGPWLLYLTLLLILHPLPMLQRLWLCIDRWHTQPECES
ncbi:hypothetical protein [Diaphorobacter sp. HDW4A]|nr:hypothetical protein [Diaphorobacter sp. HDW4A]